MSITKPFHRNHRAMKPARNAGYSGWAYIVDRSYAQNAEHYVRAFLMIQNDLQALFEYVEPSDECLTTYSYRIHALLMRTCIEIEANLKAILHENTFTAPPSRSLNMSDYRRIDVTHHLSSFEVSLPIWNDGSRIWKPFEAWKSTRGLPNASHASLPWYQAYNASKHDRHVEFKRANLEMLVTSAAGLLVLISSQFRDQEFSAGDSALSIGGDDFHSMESATGSFFRIKYPDDWTDNELYDFDWSTLKSHQDRFGKIDFDAIPS